MSAPDKKTVEEDERAWTAKVDEEDAIDESITVKTLGKFSVFNARGDTISRCKRSL